MEPEWGEVARLLLASVVVMAFVIAMDRAEARDRPKKEQAAREARVMARAITRVK